MGEVTGIQWTDHTFNPWIGCQRVSPGCVNCYAEHGNTFVRIQRKQGRELWGPKGDRHVTADANWQKPLAWNRAAQSAGTPARVFCASLADVFEDRRDLDAPRYRLFDLIERTAFLDWQLLTKRIDRVQHLVPERWMEDGFPSNVWMGTSVEDQRRADERIPELQNLPARIRFLSCEPLLERVTLPLQGIDWVIVGGESGTNARPFDVAWALDIIIQCQFSGVAPFVKQIGRVPRVNYYHWLRWAERNGWDDDPPIFTADGAPWSIDQDGQPLTDCVVTIPMRDSHGGNMDEWPARLRVREFPKVLPEGAQVPTDVELEAAGQLNLIELMTAAGAAELERTQ